MAKLCRVCGCKEDQGCLKYANAKLDRCPRDMLPTGYSWRADQEKRYGQRLVDRALGPTHSNRR